MDLPFLMSKKEEFYVTNNHWFYHCSNCWLHIQPSVWTAVQVANKAAWTVTWESNRVSANLLCFAHTL